MAQQISDGNDPANTHRMELRLKKMITACGWNRLPDIAAVSFLRFRDTGDMAKAAPKIRNDYQQVVRSFCRWCVRRGRMAIDPFQSLDTVKVNGDIRRQRHSLTDTEVQRLLEATPEPRRTVYLTALLTGLRRAEMEQLRWFDVHLDSPKPYLDVWASTTKNGQKAIIWLRDDLATALRSMDLSGDSIFDVPDMKTFKADLARAEIAAMDGQGRIVDFHALRHTLATNLGRVGVSVQVAMQVMRHSDVRLTTKVYTDSTLLPTAEAIECLPRWQIQKNDKMIATGTHDTPVSPATLPATLLPSLKVISGHDVAQSADMSNTNQTRMDGEETPDYHGDNDGHGKFRGVGIEPT